MEQTYAKANVVRVLTNLFQCFIVIIINNMKSKWKKKILLLEVDKSVMH